MSKKNAYIRQMQIRKAMLEHIRSGFEEVSATKAAERALWIAMAALNRAFGIGRTRMMRDYVPAFEAITKEYEARLREVDRDYADGKLEQEINAILDSDVRIGRSDNEVTVHAKSYL